MCRPYYTCAISSYVEQKELTLPERLVPVGVLWKILLFVVDGHYCIVCLSSIWGFWLPFWSFQSFQTFLTIHHVFQPLSSIKRLESQIFVVGASEPKCLNRPGSPM
jgi:hypothetical protein